MSWKEAPRHCIECDELLVKTKDVEQHWACTNGKCKRNGLLTMVWIVRSSDLVGL